MAALQDIKRRIRSVGGTRQITKAMQLVAASKLRRYQEGAIAPRAYTQASRELLARLGSPSDVLRHPLYQRRPIKTVLTVMIAGDRSLAGPYNGNIYRVFNDHAKQFKVPHQVICVGRQAAHHIAKAVGADEIAAYRIENGPGQTELVAPILRQVTDLFETHHVDAVFFVYTKFHSSVRQEVVLSQLLPVVPEVGQATKSELEPSPEVLLDVATRRLLKAQILQAVVDSRASEQAARMLAMMTATDNADDLIDDLTLAYNNARQSAITQELAEITAGAEVING